MNHADIITSLVNQCDLDKSQVEWKFCFLKAQTHQYEFYVSRTPFLEISGYAGAGPKKDRNHHGLSVPVTWSGSWGLSEIPTEEYAD